MSEVEKEVEEDEVPSGDGSEESRSSSGSIEEDDEEEDGEDEEDDVVDEVAEGEVKSKQTVADKIARLQEEIEEGELVDEPLPTEGVTGEVVEKKKKKDEHAKLWPDLEDKFHPSDVKVVVEKIVREYLEGTPYDPDDTPKLIKVLTDAIQNRVKTLKYRRYKIITLVTLGEKRGAGATSVTRCVWDPMSDCMATYTFMSDTLFCCVTVYGVYFY